MALRLRASYLLLVGLVAMAGCSRDVSKQYGFRRPTGSVNGTEVLAALFEEAGHKTSGWSRFSPRLRKKADCIVWFTQSMKAPSKEVREWIDEWLDEEPGRTFIYVGRDYDAAIDYWTQMRSGTQGDEFRALSRNLADARTDHDVMTRGLDPQEDAVWFEIDRAQAPKTVAQVQGDPEWLADVDVAKTNVSLNSRFKPSDDFETLLADGNDVILARRENWDSQLLVATNGSFLLNLPLVNHENRKLAAKLINSIGPAPQRVVFLEARFGEPTVSEEDPDEERVSLFRYFGLAPLNLILLHLAVVGTVFLFGRSPIFGLPRSMKDRKLADFGRHVEALGNLLERTNDARFANARIQHFEQASHGTSGQSASPEVSRPTPEKGRDTNS